jgi:hypothetical protein
MKREWNYSSNFREGEVELFKKLELKGVEELELSSEQRTKCMEVFAEVKKLYQDLGVDLSVVPEPDIKLVPGLLAKHKIHGAYNIGKQVILLDEFDIGVIAHEYAHHLGRLKLFASSSLGDTTEDRLYFRTGFM